MVVQMLDSLLDGMLREAGQILLRKAIIDGQEFYLKRNVHGLYHLSNESEWMHIQGIPSESTLQSLWFQARLVDYNKLKGLVDSGKEIDIFDESARAIMFPNTLGFGIPGYNPESLVRIIEGALSPLQKPTFSS